MNVSAATSAVPAGTDQFVLHGRPLRPGARLAETARFDSNLWSLNPAILQKSGLARALDFSDVPEIHRLTLKLLAYSMLSGVLPDHEKRLAIHTVAGKHDPLRYFCNWLEATYPSVLISDLRDEHMKKFITHVMTHVRAPNQRHNLRTAVALFWRYRANLGGQGLSFDPRTRDYWYVGPSPKGEENATPRIPEEVHGPLLGWAMRFIDDFSGDIISAATTWRENRRRTAERGKPNERPRTERGSVKRSIDRYLRESRDLQRPLPGIDGIVNVRAVSRILACHRTAIERYSKLLQSAAEQVGVSPFVELKGLLKGQLDGDPWLDGITYDPKRDDSLARLTPVLQTACYIAIAFLSGMRDAEVKHLQVGCVSGLRDSHGRTVRWRVTSLAFKDEDPEGVEATWIVGAPAARAVAVLEKLLASTGSNSTFLFSALPTSGGRASSGRSGNEALTVQRTVIALNQFVTWVGNYCAARSRVDGIPLHNGKVWRLTTRQFRRTLAWYIARRPGGSIVGAIAYRHHSVQMFEGYAGTSESGFRAEVEAEEALARGEHLLAMIEQHEHAELRGPAAQEAFRRLDAMDRSGAFAGTIQTDPKRFQRLLASKGPQIYPGKYVTCAFLLRKARCHASEDGPDVPSCQPFTCGNVALTKGNIKEWKEELRLIDQDLNEGALLPPLLIARLHEQRAKIIRLLKEASKA